MGCIKILFWAIFYGGQAPNLLPGAPTTSWCREGEACLPLWVALLVAGEGSDPRPKKPPAHASAEHVQCTYIVQCTHLPGAMAMCQFKLHIRDNFLAEPCPQSLIFV